MEFQQNYLHSPGLEPEEAFEAFRPED